MSLEAVTVWAVLAAIAFAVAFVLHWVGAGRNPVDWAGLMALGAAFLAVHLIAPVWPWRRP